MARGHRSQPTPERTPEERERARQDRERRRAEREGREFEAPQSAPHGDELAPAWSAPAHDAPVESLHDVDPPHGDPLAPHAQPHERGWSRLHPEGGEAHAPSEQASETGAPEPHHSAEPPTDELQTLPEAPAALEHRGGEAGAVEAPWGDPLAAAEPSAAAEPQAGAEPSVAAEPQAAEGPTGEMGPPAVVETPAVGEMPGVVEPASAVEPPAIGETPALVETPAAVEPPAIGEPPAAAGPPSEAEPPALAEMPAAAEPSSVAEPPALAEPPAAVEPPAVGEPPSVAEPPAMEKPPTVTEPRAVGEPSALEPPSAEPDTQHAPQEASAPFPVDQEAPVLGGAAGAPPRMPDAPPAQGWTSQPSLATADLDSVRFARAQPRPRQVGHGWPRRLIALVGLLVVVAAIVLLVRSLTSTSHRSAAKSATSTVFKLVIPEGDTRLQIAQLAAREGLVGDYRAASRTSPLLDPASYGAPRGTPDLEGFLFPATYDMYDGSPVNRLVQEQLEAFRENFGPSEIARARALGITPYQLLTVASMIEREAQVPADRPKIAAVIYNRLHAGMPLGIDATLYYAIELRTGKPTYTAELTAAQLRMPSVYNTRVHTGLPPTPISNPGLASIHAAAHPAHVPYLYYVLAPDGCGEHVFSTTAAAFEVNAAAYRAAVRNNGGRPPTCKKH